MVDLPKPLTRRHMLMAGVTATAAAGAVACSAEPVQVFGTYSPPEFSAAKEIDRQRFHAGLPNLLDF